jgi:polyisoprenoid-binding protein YceI
MSTTQTATQIPTGTWTVDPVHSNANFEVEHGGLSVFRGGFKPVGAKLVSDHDGLVLEGGVSVESISVDDENIRPHLLAPDFFDAERNPEIRFRSTEISGSPDHLKVRGELTMAGASVPVEAQGRLRGPISLGEHGDKLALDLEATVDRTAFGMDWQMEMPGGAPALANEVKLLVSLELGHEAPQQRGDSVDASQE